METEQAMLSLLSDLFQTADEQRGKSLVSLHARAEALNITDREEFQGIIEERRARRWIEKLRMGPDDEFYTRITLAGMEAVCEQRTAQ